MRLGRIKCKIDWKNDVAKDVETGKKIVCMRGFCNFLSIPNKAKILWLSVYDKPAKNRLAIRSNNDWNVVWIEKRSILLYYHATKLLNDIYIRDGRYILYIRADWK
jgi:hypothetical protein